MIASSEVLSGADPLAVSICACAGDAESAGIRLFRWVEVQSQPAQPITVQDAFDGVPLAVAAWRFAQTAKIGRQLQGKHEGLSL